MSYKLDKKPARQKNKVRRGQQSPTPHLTETAFAIIDLDPRPPDRR